MAPAFLIPPGHRAEVFNAARLFILSNNPELLYLGGLGAAGQTRQGLISNLWTDLYPSELSCLFFILQDFGGWSALRLVLATGEPLTPISGLTGWWVPEEGGTRGAELSLGCERDWQMLEMPAEGKKTFPRIQRQLH